MEQYGKMASGPMKPADAKDLIKDEIGFTNPNLHRRIETETEEGQKRYTIGVYDHQHSYKTVDYSTHDEESTTCEIP